MFEHILFFRAVPFLILERSLLEKQEQIVPLLCVPFDEIGTCFDGHLLLKEEPIVPSCEFAADQTGPLWMISEQLFLKMRSLV